MINMWVRPELLVQNPLHIANNQHTIVINFHQEFMASMHSNFFHKQKDGGLICLPNGTAHNRHQCRKTAATDF